MQIWKQECKQANLGGWVLGGRSKQVLVTPGGAAALCSTALHCNTTPGGGVQHCVQHCTELHCTSPRGSAVCTTAARDAAQFATLL